MNELILELVDVIKQSDEYIHFKNNEQLLTCETTHALLKEYASKVSIYNEVKKYSDYIDNSEIKDEIKSLKQRMSQDENIQQYYNSYYELNNLLDDVTHIVFDGIDESIINNRWFK